MSKPRILPMPQKIEAAMLPMEEYRKVVLDMGQDKPLYLQANSLLEHRGVTRSLLFFRKNENC